MITKYENLCVICNKPAKHRHHLINGHGKREISDRWDATVPLCDECHNMSQNSVHLNSKMEAMSHIIGQLWIERQMLIEKYQLPFEDLSEETREAFRALIGKSYL